MLLRNISKLNGPNDGTRSLFESIAIPEVNQALVDWIKNANASGVLIGGAACGYYTRPRTTTDLDILFLSVKDIPIQVDGFKRTRPGAFVHKSTHVEVEVIAPETINLSAELVSKVFNTAVVSDGIRVASPTGLVALKLQRMSRYDEGDIWGLIETGKVDLSGWPISQAQFDVYNTIYSKVHTS
jgi:hypothetical protein